MHWRTLRWTMLAIIYVLLMSAILVAVTTPAPAQTQDCVPLDQVDGLVKQWDQTLLAVGEAGVLLVRLYANAETGVWTLFSIHPDGTACVIATNAGEA